MVHFAKHRQDTTVLTAARIAGAVTVCKAHVRVFSYEQYHIFITRPGGYVLNKAIQVCAASKGMVFEPF